MVHRRRKTWLSTGKVPSGPSNERCIRGLEQIVFVAVELTHDGHLQWPVALMGELRHGKLLDPGELSLRGTI